MRPSQSGQALQPHEVLIVTVGSDSTSYMTDNKATARSWGIPAFDCREWSRNPVTRGQHRGHSGWEDSVFEEKMKAEREAFVRPAMRIIRQQAKAGAKKAPRKAD